MFSFFLYNNLYICWIFNLCRLVSMLAGGIDLTFEFYAVLAATKVGSKHVLSMESVDRHSCVVVLHLGLNSMLIFLQVYI